MTETAEAKHQSITLDDVSQRINAICDDHLEALRNANTSFNSRIDALAAAIDLSPELDKDTVGAIVLGQVNKMMKAAAELAG